MRIVKVSIATFSNISKIQLNCESRVLIFIPSKKNFLSLTKAKNGSGLPAQNVLESILIRSVRDFQGFTIGA